MNSLRRRITSGLGANAYNQVVTVAVQLAGVPIFLSAWGAGLYGEWLILFAIPAYFLAGDFGFSQSAGNDMAGKLACSDFEGALRVFQSLGKVVFSIVVIGLVLGVGVVSVLPVATLFNFEMLNDLDARYILILLIAEVSVRVANGMLFAALRAGRDYAFQLFLNASTRLLQFSFVWAAVLCGWGPIAVACTFLIVRVLSTPVVALSVRVRQPWARFGFNLSDRAEVRRLLKPALASGILPLAQALNIQGMVLVVGAVLGPISVVVFSTLRTLSRVIVQVISAVSQSTEPEIAASFGARQSGVAMRLYINAQSGCIWLALIGVLGLLCFGDYLVQFWTRGAIAVHWGLFGALLVAAFVTAFWITPLTALKAANCHVEITKVIIGASLGAVLGGWFFLSVTENILAAGVAVAVMDAVIAGYAFLAVGRFFGVPSRQLMGRSLSPTPVLGIFR